MQTYLIIDREMISLTGYIDSHTSSFLFDKNRLFALAERQRNYEDLPISFREATGDKK